MVRTALLRSATILNNTLSDLNSRSPSIDRLFRYAWPIVQSLIPGVVFWRLSHSLIWDPSPLLLWLLAGWRPVLQVAARGLYLAIFVIGVLWIWNVPVLSLPFYLQFTGLDELPISMGTELLFAGVALLMLLPLSARFKPPALVAVLVPLAVIAVIGLKASPLGKRHGPVENNLKVTPISAIQSLAPNATLFLEGKRPPDVIPLSSEQPTLQHWIARTPKIPSRLALVIVESWSENPKNLETILAAVRSTGAAIVESGYTSYKGATLQGELRELCSIHVSLGSGFGREAIRNCVPRQLSAQGYHTVAVHGYLPNFYLRSIIWKQIGFQETLFSTAFANRPRCDGAFSGICDSGLLSAGLGLLGSRDHIFVHMVTLTSHEPVPPGQLDIGCGLFATIHSDSDSQRLARQAICHLVTDLAQQPTQNAVIYVVGDHAPPSLVGSTLVPDGSVPYFIMRSGRN